MGNKMNKQTSGEPVAKKPYVSVETCTNCGGDELRWYVGTQGPRDVPDGRIRMSEVSAIAFLGCEECSETLDTIYSHHIDHILNGEPVDG